MQFVFYVIFVVLVVAADQLTKALVVANIPLGGHVDFLPGFLDFTYLRNTGAAFSSFERWSIAAIYAGGLGNMIDRLRLGYVVDMIETQFMDFPVFNVADCFITCGCIALFVSLGLFNKEFWKEDKK